MRSTIKRSPESGFTLIEIMVALAIAAVALILILSANTASLRQSVNSRLSERLTRAAESKFNEWKLGAERSNEGPLPGFSGYSWQVSASREDLRPLRRLQRVRFAVSGPGGAAFEWSELRNLAEGTP